MRDTNLDLNSDFVHEQFGPAAGAEPLPTVLPAGTTFVSTINGVAGSLTFSGGTSGFTFSGVGATVTLSSPLTTKGDLLAHDGTNGVRLSAGADGTFLVADSAQAVGVKWLGGNAGWTAWTGTASKATKDTATATLADVAQGLKAVVDALLALNILKA
ncbi:MAG TPA: hypothetical protein VN256_13235 [Pyrinomonadaceae bacterium]|nr:hypothetical protein [Pyrinomonadaceae bacterium]